MISNDTELVFMDEWTSDSLNCEDAKRILQGNFNDLLFCINHLGFTTIFLYFQLFILLGGLIMLSQKHADAKRVNYRSGFFITTNVLPDFGHQVDQEAILRRLKVFHTRTLQHKDSSVTGNYEIVEQ